MGVKKLAKTDGKGNKKLQNGYKTVTKVYKTVTNCEIFNRGGVVGQIAQFQENKKGRVCAIFYLTNFRIYDIMEVRPSAAGREAFKARANLSSGLPC